MQSPRELYGDRPGEYLNNRAIYNLETGGRHAHTVTPIRHEECPLRYECDQLLDCGRATTFVARNEADRFVDGVRDVVGPQAELEVLETSNRSRVGIVTCEGPDRYGLDNLRAGAYRDNWGILSSSETTFEQVTVPDGA